MIPSRSPALAPSRVNLFLLLVCILAAIPMVYFGATYYIDYDGYWHVFIAKQTWSSFLGEYQATAHPPLFFLLLRGAITIGDSRLVYRLVSILSGLGAIFVIGRIARDVTGSRLAAVLTAFMFGLSASVILISCEVRSYMLCAFLALLAFQSYLNIMTVEPGQTGLGARIRFSASLCLAILSHYSALFVFMACLAAPVYLALVNKEYRARLIPFLRGRWRENFLTFFPVFVLGLALYWFQGRPFASPLVYLSQFYFDPAGSESRIEFLLRNLQNAFDLFTPVRFDPALIPVCIFAAMTVYVARFRTEERDIRLNLTIAVFFLMLGAFMVAALRGRYPFGGGLRHQFLLFPFLALSAVGILNKISSLMPVRNIRIILLAAGFMASGANSMAAYARFQNIRDDNATRDIALFRSFFQHPRVVLLDQFNVVSFFAHHHDWKWTTVARHGSLYKYVVSKNGNEFTVMRENSVWNFDFTAANSYPYIKQALEAAAGEPITVFCIDQAGSHVPRAPADEQAFEQNVRMLASQAGLHLKRLVVKGVDIFAQFDRR